MYISVVEQLGKEAKLINGWVLWSVAVLVTLRKEYLNIRLNKIDVHVHLHQIKCEACQEGV